MIDSQSFITSSAMPSWDNRDLSFSVEITMSSEGARSPGDNNLGNLSLAATRDSIHAPLSSLDMHRK